MGWIMPNSSIDLANSNIFSFSKLVLGWYGFTLIWSIGSSITLPIISSAFLSLAVLISSFGSFSKAESPLPKGCLL